MKLCILTEGFAYTGYGHVVRCLAIARKFRQYHISVSFFINGDENVLSMLSEFSVESIAWQKDTISLREKLESVDILLIDSYIASKSTYYFLQSIVPFCIYLDDFNRLDYPPGVIVNGTVGVEALPYNFEKNRFYLLGKDYVILRDEFKGIRHEKIISSEISSILVTFGGTDPLNVTPRILKVLVESFPQWEKRIVIGAAFKSNEVIESLADKRTKLYFNVSAIQMRDLMLSSDVAISASGQTINELAVTGLPAIVFKVAENQSYNISGWMRYGFIETYIDAINGWKDEDLVEALHLLLPIKKRRLLSICGQVLMDAEGGDRLVRKSLFLFAIQNMQFRRAQELDSKALFDLANDSLVRQNSFSTHPIVWEEHETWLHSVLSNTQRLLYVFLLRDSLFAQIRFDTTDSDWRESIISISIGARFRGWGLAPVILQKAITQLKSENRACIQICAYIKVENIASRKAFERAGFKQVERKSEEVLKYIYVYGE